MSQINESCLYRKVFLDIVVGDDSRKVQTLGLLKSILATTAGSVIKSVGVAVLHCDHTFVPTSLKQVLHYFL